MVEDNPRTSIEETKQKICQRLKPAGSDDIIAEGDHICVAVTDPFSSSLFAIPVRGADCKHWECFDLNIWLRTRPGKRSSDTGEPTIPDCWKCPICDLDARPVRLRIDEFFTDVRAKLIMNGEESIKKICIQFDGSWRPLPEPDEAEDEKQSPAASGQKRPVLSQATGPEPAQVIFIEDD
ncbi:MIZ zinc finger protein [Ophiocordyceps camponoti-floridani]|uniref:MIZ zinc finger protein n=1 Tax=Ophiocordyceps camponoti-floridani TaxID=2030778 RepID=A0A8H4VGQ2_9HYPO|nr:MIZ zinc finger protein [Ophiocordyceps camponoti-floridani]